MLTGQARWAVQTEEFPREETGDSGTQRVTAPKNMFFRPLVSWRGSQYVYGTELQCLL